MYKRCTKWWVKQIDFIVFDLIAIQVSFCLAYWFQYGMAWYQFSSGKNMAISFALINLIVVFFNESYEDILMRDAWEEFCAVIHHVTWVILLNLLYLFFMREEIVSSRLFLFMWFIALVFTWDIRMLRKNYLKIRKKD